MILQGNYCTLLGHLPSYEDIALLLGSPQFVHMPATGAAPLDTVGWPRGCGNETVPWDFWTWKEGTHARNTNLRKCIYKVLKAVICHLSDIVNLEINQG